MSEETARIYDRARGSSASPIEAWEDLRALAEAVDWDVERMLRDSDADGGTVSDRESPR